LCPQKWGLSRVQYEALRLGTPALADESERLKLMAHIDAQVAMLYGIGFEDMQYVLSIFPLVVEEQKQLVLLYLNELQFKTELTCQDGGE